jgi:hypothetical protein
VDDIALPERFYYLGIIFAECLCDWGRRIVPLFNYTLTFALQLMKRTINLSQGSRLVLHLSLRRLSRFLEAASTGQESVNPLRLHVGDFSLPLVDIGAFQVSELRGSPHQLTSSQSSQSVL